MGRAGCHLLVCCTFMCACVPFVELDLFVLIDNVVEVSSFSSFLCDGVSFV